MSISSSISPDQHNFRAPAPAGLPNDGFRCPRVIV
ncbi:hypothetical protein F0726_02239 [Acidithiobacillus caldus]|nr:hypothetical protein F0726_02239 [Acidithiobacillus caldus]